MRKEVIFAIAAGIIVGVVLALGIWRANTALSEPENPQVASSSTEQTTPTPSEMFGLTLSEPENLDVKTQNPTLISGLSSPSTWIALISDTGDSLLTKTDESGAFSQEINLSGGINQITAIALQNDREAITVQNTILFTTQLFQDEEEPTTTDENQEEEEEATGEADPIREKVKEKIKEAQKNPKAFVGTITDITENTIQIQNMTGEIQQISVSDDTTFSNIIDDAEEIEYGDLAIGDFIASMGTVLESSVLEALRILVTDEFVPTNKTARIGQIIVSEDYDFVLRTLPENINANLNNNATINILQDNKFIETDEDSIESGDTVILFGNLEEDMFAVTDVYITIKAEIETTEELSE